MARLDSARRLAVLRGGVTASERDPVLQSLVAEALELAAAPLGAVTLVMGSIQYFRASQGLPPDLATSLATSRCDSFCQFVVESEEAFVVSHASEDERVPQTLVRSHSIEAYVGVPVRVQGEIVGSLCVIDVVPRVFPSDLPARLEPLAARVSARLEALARQVSRQAQIAARAESAESPSSPVALAEGLCFQTRLLERAMVEIGPLSRVGRALGKGELSTTEALRAAVALTEAAPLFDLLLEESRQISALSSKLRDALRSEWG